MPFTAARKQLAPAEQQAIDDLISEWSGGTGVPPQAAENLRRENGMSAKDFSKYLNGLASGKGKMSLAGIGPKAEFERIGKQHCQEVVVLRERGQASLRDRCQRRRVGQHDQARARMQQARGGRQCVVQPKLLRRRLRIPAHQCVECMQRATVSTDRIIAVCTACE